MSANAVLIIMMKYHSVVEVMATIIINKHKSYRRKLSESKKNTWKLFKGIIRSLKLKIFISDKSTLSLTAHIWDAAASALIDWWKMEMAYL